MDKIFQALADPSRRQLLDRLHSGNGQTLAQLCEGLTMSRQAVSKHLRLLEEANLVTTIKRGREKLHYLNPVPIAEISERWIEKYEASRLTALSRLKQELEQNDMEKPTFVYVTYIATTPEKLWEALTNAAFCRQYWFGMLQESDWQVGSSWSIKSGDDGTVWDAGTIVEVERPRRIVISWRHEKHEELKAIGFTTATFDIEQLGETVKLTVTHEAPVGGEAFIKSVSGGWPEILSNLKTLLETGVILPEAPKK